MIAFTCGSLLFASNPKIELSTFIGEWNYLVKGTPDGDVEGIIKISHEKGVYIGMVIDHAGNEYVITNLKIEGNKLKGQIDYQASILQLELTLKDDLITGLILIPDSENLNITAKRKI